MIVRSDLMSMCVKRKVLVHSNISNENTITEMEDNKIINVKNKVMTICNWCHDKRKQLVGPKAYHSSFDDDQLM